MHIAGDVVLCCSLPRLLLIAMTIYLFLVRQACLTQYVYCELLAIGRRLCDIPPLNGAVSGARIILLLVLVVLLRWLQLCACAALVVRCPSSALIVCCLLSLCGAVCCAWWLVVFLSAAKFEVYLRWLAAFAFLVYGSRRLVRLLLSWWCGCAFASVVRLAAAAVLAVCALLVLALCMRRLPATVAASQNRPWSV